MNEFLLEAIESSNNSQAVVTGIVNKGAVRLGSVFTQVTLPSQADNVTCQVQLTIIKIVAYRHVLDELPSGMTGEIHMQGTGSDCLVPGGMIKTSVA